MISDMDFSWGRSVAFVVQAIKIIDMIQKRSSLNVKLDHQSDNWYDCSIDLRSLEFG